MPVVTLTELTLRSLKPPERGFVIYTDKSLKGFGVRVTANGARAYVLTYGPDRRRITIGDAGLVKLADARKKAKDMLADRQLHGDTPQVSYDDAFERFMAGYVEKNKPSTVRETERLLAKHLSPALKGKKLDKATKPRIVDILDGIKARSERRHFYTAAYTFFRWCRRYDLPNPLDGVEKPSKSQSRARLITEDEFRRIWAASLECGTYGLLVRVLAVTGQRLNQIASLSGKFIERNDRTILWPPALMKNNREFLLPYSDLLHSLLPQGDGLLFTTEEGKPWNSWTDPHIELLKLAGVQHFTRHDWRRFYSSTHSAIGTQPHIRELLLSHSFGTEVSRIYDRHTYLAEKREAQAHYERHLAALLSP